VVSGQLVSCAGALRFLTLAHRPRGTPPYIFYKLLILKYETTYPHLWKSLCVTPNLGLRLLNKSAGLPDSFKDIRHRKFLTFR
jgi:hypothetical protein